MRALDAFLGLAGDAGGQRAGEKLASFRRFLLVYGAVRSGLWMALGGALDPVILGSGLGLALCAVAGFAPRARVGLAVFSTRLALALLFVQLGWTFPLTDNHFFIELFALGLVSLAGSDGRDDALVLQALQWLAAIALFEAGLQKLLYGHYLHGDFLAFMVGQGDRFADLFRPLLSPEEVARLAAYDPLRTGAGPFRVDSAVFVAASNAVVLAELVLPALLVWRRTRTAAAVLAIVFVAVLQLGARELGFAVIFSGLLSLFLPSTWCVRVLIFLGALLAAAVLAQAGILPGGGWLEAGSL